MYSLHKTPTLIVLLPEISFLLPDRSHSLVLAGVICLPVSILIFSERKAISGTQSKQVLIKNIIGFKTYDVIYF